MNKNDYFRRLPKVDILLKEQKVQDLCAQFGRELVAEAVREELDVIRKLIAGESFHEAENRLNDFIVKLEERIHEIMEMSMKKVWNATGIILHTNLGRAPLGEKQVRSAVNALTNYSNLEFDLESGNRWKRRLHYANLISKVTGSEDAVAVNNNAASLTLIFSALSKGKQVIVSRGESIEIGGRFRIPEVIEQSGALLKEVGTTNRTRISDYENAITEETGAILKVHTSNYKVVGFTEEVSLEQLVELGNKYHLPVIMDLGSGVLVELEKYGLEHEPTVQEMIKTGADLVCFSGDKLLGGPQAGIITGKKCWIQKLENHPLMRAIRLDKCAIAMLETTFREYLDECNALKNIPVLRMIERKAAEIKEQAEMAKQELQQELEKLCSEHIELNLEIEESISMVGGGSLPGNTMNSYALTIQSENKSCDELAYLLRKLPVPIICYINNEKIWLDMRTILPEDAIEIIKELKDFLADVCGNRTHPGRD